MLRFRLGPRANSDYSYVVSVSLCAWKHSAPTGRIFVKLDEGKVKVKVTPQQDTKAERWSRVIELLFL